MLFEILFITIALITFVAVVGFLTGGRAPALPKCLRMLVLASMLVSAGCGVTVDKRTGLFVEGSISAPQLQNIAEGDTPQGAVATATPAEAETTTTALHAEQHAHADKAFIIVKSNNRSETDAESAITNAAELAAAIGLSGGSGTTNRNGSGGVDNGDPGGGE